MKMKNKSQKPYPTNYNLLTAQDLFEAHYQMLLIALQKEFTKLNVKMDIIIKNV